MINPPLRSLAPLAALLLLAAGLAAADRPRLLVLTDIGGDPDDQQSMVRLMLYTDELDIEGLIASAAGVPGELSTSVTRPDLIRNIVSAYGQVRGNLLLHSPGYPSAQYLLDRVCGGNPRRGTAFVGAGHDTDGSRRIIASGDASDPRPLDIAIWGGQTDLAQALWRVRNDRGTSGLAAFIARIRVHDIGDQDGIAAWMFQQFPGMRYILDQHTGSDKLQSAFRGMYIGGDETTTSRTWLDANVRVGHGPLGALYPDATYTTPNPYQGLKEGDTPSWLHFLARGLNDPDQPAWGGWGGRFAVSSGTVYRDVPDTVAGSTSGRNTVNRWRPQFQAEFQARMDWCVKPANGANHAPTAVLNGVTGLAIVHLQATSGQAVALSAAGSGDRDGNALSYRWFHYQEAGTHAGAVILGGATPSSATFTAPPVTARSTIHVILEVSDNGSPPLTACRRAVVQVDPAPSPAPTSLLSPANGSVFAPGQVVTATGSGSQLAWQVDLIGDGRPAFAAATGASMTFTVPATATAANRITITLTGTGGTGTRTYAIALPLPTPPGSISESFGDGIIAPLWLRAGDLPLVETNGRIEVDTANAASGWRGGALYVRDPWPVADGLSYRLRITVPDLSANQFTEMALTPSLTLDGEGQAQDYLRFSVRGPALALSSRQAGISSTLWTGQGVTAGQTLAVDLMADGSDVTLLIDGAVRFDGAHGMALDRVHAGFRAADKQDPAGGTVRFDDVVLTTGAPVGID